MCFYQRRIRFCSAIAGLFLTALVSYGCSTVGPISISKGRAQYNDAITRTDDQQQLMSIVRGRYGETYNMLSVTGVAANIRFGANAGAQVGWGPRDNYVGNLVPFSAGVAYEENPTITYAPAQGATYVRKLLSPIPLELLVLSFSVSGDYFTMMVNRINHIRNPDFLPPSVEPDPRFIRLTQLLRELHDAGVSVLVADPRQEVDFDLVIEGYAPMYTQKVRELIALLGLSMPADESEGIVLPIYFALHGKRLGGIGIITRSTFDLTEILKACVEVPEEHARSGLAITYPPVGLPGQGVRIRLSKGRPENAWLAVKYRGNWFYIDETDQRTKGLFRATSALWNVGITAGAEQKPAPVLTLPVSR